MTELNWYHSVNKNSISIQIFKDNWVNYAPGEKKKKDWKELPKRDEFYIFVFHFVPFENYSKVLRKGSKKMREDGKEP